MHTKKRNITETNYKNWLQLILEKRILCQDRNSITTLIKVRYASIEIVFNLNSKKEFWFCSSVWETETFFGIVIFWVGGKTCIVKNEKWIVFPESRYVNSNPEQSTCVVPQSAFTCSNTTIEASKYYVKYVQSEALELGRVLLLTFHTFMAH